MTTVDVACECTDCPCAQRVAVTVDRFGDEAPVLCHACENHETGGEG